MKKILQFIFSVKNENEHKVVRLLGLKFKFKNHSKILENKLNTIVDSINREELSMLKQLDSLHELCKLNKLEKLDRLDAIDNINGNVSKIQMFDVLPRDYFFTEAHKATINYIKEHMDPRNIMFLENKYSNLSFAIDKVTLDGLYLEFGVFQGSTINHISGQRPNIKFYGFDSFEGLPEDWIGWDQAKTSFNVDCLPNVRENVELIKGWFNDTLPNFKEQHPEKIAFMHVDSDIYSGARDVFANVYDRIQNGTIIVFDEYFNYWNWENHEYKAFQEFVTEHNVKYEYLAVADQQVTVRILRINN